MSKVFIFNAGPTALYVNVNNAPPPKILTVPAADPATWIPGHLDAADLPDFTGSPAGNPGEFKVGDNKVGLTLASDESTANVVLPIPTSVNPNNTLQLYVFWESSANVSWMLLKDGKPIGGNLSLGG